MAEKREQRFAFEAWIITWRGPAPFFFAPLPPDICEEIARLARSLSYGWGMIPVEAVVKEVAFTTSLFPKDGGYLLPLKDKVRRSAGITANDLISVDLTLGPAK